jgi:hypothetical protein
MSRPVRPATAPDRRDDARPLTGAGPAGAGPAGADPAGAAPVGSDSAGAAPRSRWGIFGATVLLLVNLAVGLVLGYLAVILVVAYDSCVLQECSYEGFTFGWLLALIGPPVVLIVTAAVTVLRLVRRQRVWWMPLVGLVVAGALWLVGTQIVFTAVPGSSFW